MVGSWGQQSCSLCDGGREEERTKEEEERGKKEGHQGQDRHFRVTCFLLQAPRPQTPAVRKARLSSGASAF